MGKKLALCIGINDYPGTGSDLSGCVNDANDWGKILSQQGFTVKKLLNKDATRKNILDIMKIMIDSAVKGDSIIFQYSGHGTYIPDKDSDESDGTDECLCPYDLKTKGPVTDDELNDLFTSKKNGVKLVLLSDSCHSGTVTRFAPVTTPRSVTGGKEPVRKVKFLPPANFLSPKELSKLGMIRTFRRSSPPGRYGSLLMSGCQDVEYQLRCLFPKSPQWSFHFCGIAGTQTYKTHFHLPGLVQGYP